MPSAPHSLAARLHPPLYEPTTLSEGGASTSLRSSTETRTLAATSKPALSPQLMSPETATGTGAEHDETLYGMANNDHEDSAEPGGGVARGDLQGLVTRG